MSDHDLDDFYSYVYNSKKYRTKLEVSISNGLWEYSTVLVWKSTILFIYEKLFQIKVLGGTLPDAFNSQLQNANNSVHSCYDFCCIPDDCIYTNLHRIWSNVEGNYKQVFKGLLDDRNSLSHVNRYEEDFNEQWFKTYFEKAFKLLKYLQGLNNIQFSQRIYSAIEENKSMQYFSEQDINYLFSKEEYENTKVINYLLDNLSIYDYSDSLKQKMKEDAIESYLDSSSFTKALSNGKRLVKLADYFTESDVKNILTGIFERQGTPNQIVLSGEMEDILSELFDKTVNLEGLEQEWDKCITKLLELSEEKYGELKNKFSETYGETRDPSEFF